MLAITEITTLKAAKAIAGSLGFPSKMPGTSYGIPATACKIGAKLVLLAGSTCSGCYALKGNYHKYQSVKVSQAARLAGLDHPQWANAMVYMLRAAHGLDGHKVASKVSSPGWHRWHDAGDLQSTGHLAAICQIARRTPELSHWLPTREVGILATYVKAGGVIPANLTIRVSATMVDGNATARWPTTSTVHHHEAAKGQSCPAPTQGNECGSCRACWSLDVPNVSYHKH